MARKTSHSGSQPPSDKSDTGPRSMADVGRGGIQLGPRYPTGIQLENGQIPEGKQRGIQGIQLIATERLGRGVNAENGEKGLQEGESRIPRIPPPSGGGFVISVEGRATAARKDQRSRLVACDERGIRVGEDHQNARLTNAQVEWLRDRYDAMKDVEEAGGPRVALKPLALALGVHLNTVKDVVYFRRRNVFPARWKRIDN